MAGIWKRITEFFRGGRLDGELNDEVAFHLASLEEEFRLKGMDPSSAAAAARREFGGVARAMETYREERGLPWLENLAKDLRYAARVLRLNPGFTAAAVLSLALGIGASTAIFSMFHTLMLRMLPVHQPEELVSLYRTGGWGSGIASYPLYQEIGKRGDLFQGVIGSTTAAKTHFRTGSGDRLESVQSEFVTGNYFGVLGVASALGRVFGAADDHTPHAHPVVVLSYDFWRNRFGSDPPSLAAVWCWTISR
jgi:putative ABC transport system permease protein